MNKISALPEAATSSRFASSKLTLPKLSVCGVKAIALGGLIFTLAACGGGNSTVLGPKPVKNDTGGSSGVYESSDKFANLCEAPRSGRSQFTNIAFPDKRGTRTDEKNFLRSWTNETYLWFDEVTDRSPTVASETPQDYFMLLKTNRTTSSGAPKDNFHFYEPTADAEAWEAGISYDYGYRLKVYSSTPPRRFYIAYVEPGSPAANAGVQRGDRVIKIDNYDLINENSDAGLNALNEGLFPSVLGAAHNFELQATDGTTKNVSLQSAQIDSKTVLKTAVLDTSTGPVGYLVFNTHVEKSQDEWVVAINQLQQAGVSDLVLDLRYNGGGLLSIASLASYMISGSNVAGKVFYEQIQNSKQPRLEPFPFLDEGIYGLNRNLALPTLNLNRVYILSSESTCSASEAIINGLRGANVQVFLIGGTTCGKPYGFYPEHNCGTTYYTIQLKGANAKGFGEYSDGFIPSNSDNGTTRIKGCSAEDDLTRQLGDANETMLATALRFRATGSCAATVTRNLQKTQAEAEQGEFILPEIRKIMVLDK
ncbi:S41 family peptidase [Cellvibrio fontiphilus]|uniref:S41 family peptidase n=1 Tax=Cellvibrio fontiphilus TaxID=1815559 RepID=A0ABV7FMV8_9GAMM